MCTWDRDGDEVAEGLDSIGRDSNVLSSWYGWWFFGFCLQLVGAWVLLTVGGRPSGDGPVFRYNLLRLYYNIILKRLYWKTRPSPDAYVPFTYVSITSLHFFNFPPKFVSPSVLPSAVQYSQFHSRRGNSSRIQVLIPYVFETYFVSRPFPNIVYLYLYCFLTQPYVCTDV